MKKPKRVKTRRFPIPPNQPHRDRKNDYQRKGKKLTEESIDSGSPK